VSDDVDSLTALKDLVSRGKISTEAALEELIDMVRHMRGLISTLAAEVGRLKASQ
jgi:hypothetical protein